MSDENNNVENKQEENKTGKNRLKVKIKNIFLIFLVITAVFFITAKTSIAQEESLYTFKDSIQNFFINRIIILLTLAAITTRKLRLKTAIFSMWR